MASDRPDDEIHNSLRIDEIIIKKDIQQIESRISRLVDKHREPNFSENRILFVEDNKSIAALILSHLEDFGYRSSHFNNAEQAWEEFINEAVYAAKENGRNQVVHKKLTE